MDKKGNKNLKTFLLFILMVVIIVIVCPVSKDHIQRFMEKVSGRDTSFKSNEIKNNKDTVSIDETSLYPYKILFDESMTNNGVKVGYLYSTTNPEKEIRIDPLTVISHPYVGVSQDDDNDHYMGVNPIDENYDTSIITLPLAEGVYRNLIKENAGTYLWGVLNEAGNEIVFKTSYNQENYAGKYFIPEPHTIYPFEIKIEDGIVTEIHLQYRE